MLLATGSGLLLACACIGYVGPARADASATDVAAARSLGQEGIALANQGKCKEAIELFERAEKILHAPTHLFRLADCMVKVGRLVEGTEVLNRLVRETLAPNAPAAFKSAQERGQALLARTQPRLAKLRINVTGPGKDVALTVTIDGRSVSSATVGVSQPADPGERTVDVSAPGFLPKSAKVTLPEAGAGEVSLSLDPDPNAEKVPAVATTPAAPDA
ncbi:MAG: hypothetical protein HOO96_45015, partial [Polyangiaceae bacterium]|nr:hypothetical protein [Polyangiaceae bacterium]